MIISMRRIVVATEWRDGRVWGEVVLSVVWGSMVTRGRVGELVGDELVVVVVLIDSEKRVLRR